MAAAKRSRDAKEHREGKRKHAIHNQARVLAASALVICDWTHGSRKLTMTRDLEVDNRQRGIATHGLYPTLYFRLCCGLHLSSLPRKHTQKGSVNGWMPISVQHHVGILNPVLHLPCQFLCLKSLDSRFYMCLLSSCSFVVLNLPCIPMNFLCLRALTAVLPNPNFSSNGTLPLTTLTQSQPTTPLSPIPDKEDSPLELPSPQNLRRRSLREGARPRWEGARQAPRNAPPCPCTSIPGTWRPSFPGTF